MARDFRTGHVRVPLNPAVLEDTDALCTSVYLRAYGGNANAIYIGGPATNFTPMTYAAASANLATGDGDITVTAASAGVEWDGKSVEFITLAGTAAGTPLAAYANDTITITVNDTVNTTLANINTAIASLPNWADTVVGNAGNFYPGDVGVTNTSGNAVNSVSSDATVTLADAGALTVTSVIESAAWNSKDLVFVQGDVPAGTPTANYVGSTISVTVNTTVNTPTANINAAVHGLANWTCVEDTAGEFFPGDAGVTATTANGVDAVAPSNTITLTDTGTLTVVSDVLTTAWDGKDIVFILDDSTPAGTPTANYAANQINITVNSTVNTTTANINTAVHNLADWSCSETTGEFYPGDGGVTVATANGVDAASANASIVTGDGDLVITSFLANADWNSKTLAIVLDSATPAGTPNAVYANDVITLTLNDVANTTTANINTALHDLTDWNCVEANAGNFFPGDCGVNTTTANGATATASSAVVTFGSGSLTVTSDVLTTAWDGKDIVFVLDDATPAGTPTANYANDTITITVNSTANTAITDINDVVHALGDWSSTFTGTNFNPEDAGLVGTTASAANATAADVAWVTGDGDLLITSAVSSADWNGKTVTIVLDSSTPAGTPNAVYANDVITLTLNDTANTTTANINTAIHNLTDWTCAEANAGNFFPGDCGVNATTANAVDEVAANGVLTTNDAGVLTITAATAGAAWNSKSIVFAEDAGTSEETPTANYDAANDTLTITVNNTANTTTANINAAIHANDSWTCVETTPGVYEPTTDASVNATTANGVTATVANDTLTLADAGAILVSTVGTGTTWNSKDIVFVVGDVPASTPTAAYADDTFTITVNSTVNTTTANIVAALDANDSCNATETTPGEFDPGDIGITGTTANGVTAAYSIYDMELSVNSGDLHIASAVATTAWDGKSIVFALDDSTPVGTPTANYVNDTITITVNSTLNTGTTALAAAIDGLPDWTCTISNGGEFDPGDAGATGTTAGAVNTAAANATLTLADAGAMTVTSAVNSTAWNSKSIVFAFGDVPVSTPTVNYVNDVITVTVNSTVNTTTANINTIIHSLPDWNCTEDTPGEFDPGDVGITATTANGVTEAYANAAVALADAGEVAVTAAVSGVAFNSKNIVFVLDDATPANTPTANYVSPTLSITVNSTVNTATADIVNAVDLLGDWGATESVGGEFDPGDAGLVGTTAGGVNEVAANATLTLADAGDVVVTAAAAGTAWNDKSLVFAINASTPAATPTAAYAANTITTDVCSTANTTTANIAAAIDLLGDWGATEGTGGELDPGDYGVTGTTANGVTAVASTAILTLADAGAVNISSNVSTTAWDGKTIVFVIDAATDANTPTANYTANTLTITVNSTVNTTTANIVAAIDALDDWGASEDTGGEFDPGDAGVIVTTSGAAGSMHAGGFLMYPGEDIEIETTMLSNIWVHAIVDGQFLSWMTRGA